MSDNITVLMGEVPSQHAFDASRHKIDRARKHLRELEGIINDYAASTPFSSTGNIEDIPVLIQNENSAPAAGRVVRALRATISVTTEKSPPPLGPIVGDIIHNLRASFDLLACELARAAGNDGKNVYFPFCDSEDGLDKMIKRRNFDQAGPDAVKLLRELCPYKGGNIALRAIHDLDIQDKHDSLIRQMVARPLLSMQISDPDKDGSRTLNFVPNAYNQSTVTLHFPPDSVFAHEELIPTLHNLVKVAAGVVEAFAALNRPPGQIPGRQ